MADEIPDSREDVQNDEVISRALRHSVGVVVGLVLIAVVGFLIVQALRPPLPEENETVITLPKNREVKAAQLPSMLLTDISEDCGISWKHFSGMEGEKLLPETMGGGVAVLDYDRDGDQDLLFVGGKSWDWAKTPNSMPQTLCLYQNDGTGHFSDVTIEAGLEPVFYGMGPAVGDFDNDGWVDLFVTAVGRNYLFRNLEGKFSDVTELAGVAGEESAWSTGSVWLDFDRDGLLDLFVVDYVVWARDLDLSLGFSLTGVGRAYGQPTSFTGTQSHLYRNEGQGRFRDVTQKMGIEVVNPNTGVPVGKGLGVAAIDVDHDGWQDIVVANDTVQNFLFMNIGGREFEEAGIPMGIAYDRSGNATGAMGLDCAYLRNNDSLAIAIGNFANEQSSLYVSRGPNPPFFDEAMPSGLGPMSRLNLTFGMFFADLDLDSRQDVVCANGHLEAEISKVQSTQQYAQPPQYFWNAGLAGASELVPFTEKELGSAAFVRMVGRGAACGDLDGDGDLDIFLVANSGSPRILRNDQKLGHHAIRIALEGSGNSNRDAIGAVVTVTSRAADGKELVEQRRVVTSTRSYLSQCEHVLTFGLGNDSRAQEVKVEWPSGRQDTFELPVNATYKIVESSADQKASPPSGMPF